MISGVITDSLGDIVGASVINVTDNPRPLIVTRMPNIKVFSGKLEHLMEVHVVGNSVKKYNVQMI